MEVGDRSCCSDIRKFQRRTHLVRGSGQLCRSNIRKEVVLLADAVDQVSVELLQAFADAWNRHDIDALMSFMTDDCIFEASAGSEVFGTRFVGRDAVRAGFADVWSTFPDAQWRNARHFVVRERGVSEWTFTGTRPDGTHVEVHGCDLFTFQGGKIALKNSYRKNRLPVNTPKR